MTAYASHVPQPGDVYRVTEGTLVVVLSDKASNLKREFTVIAPFSTLVRVYGFSEAAPWRSDTPEPGYVLWPAHRSVATDHLTRDNAKPIGRIEPEPLQAARHAIRDQFTAALPRGVYEAVQRQADQTSAEHREAVTDPKTGPEWDLD